MPILYAPAIDSAQLPKGATNTKGLFTLQYGLSLRLMKYPFKQV